MPVQSFSESEQSLVERMSKDEVALQGPDEVTAEEQCTLESSSRKSSSSSDSSGYASCEDENFHEDKEFYNTEAVERLLSEDDSDVLCTDEFCCSGRADTGLAEKSSVRSSDYVNYKIDDLDSLTAAFGQNMRKIWSYTGELDDTSQCEPGKSDVACLSRDWDSKIWNSSLYPSTSMFSAFSSKLAKSAEDVNFSPLGIALVLSDSEDSVNEFSEDELTAEDSEVEDRIQCHRLSLNKIIEEIMELTKPIEDPLPVDTEKYLKDVWKDTTEFYQLLEPDEDSHEPDLRDTEISDTDENSEGTPTQRSSEHVDNLSSAEHFFKGFSSAYKTKSLICHPVLQTPQIQQPAPPPPIALNVPCSEWCDSDPESHISASRVHLGPPSRDRILSETCKSWDSCETENCGSAEEKVAEFKPLWLKEETNTYSTIPSSRVSSELLRNEKLFKTFFRKSLQSPQNVPPASPVEEFFNSLYLPEDMLPLEVPAAISEVRKRRVSVDSGVCSVGSDDLIFRSIEELTSESSESLFSHHEKDCVDSAAGISNTDVWGDEGKQVYWTPLPIPAKTDAESPGRHSDSRKGRRENYQSTRQAKVRYIPKSRSLPAA